MIAFPLRGDIWFIRLDPTLGTEIKKTRPCLVISNSRHNQVASTVTVIPITSTELRYPSFQITIPQSTGLQESSTLEIPQIRVADKLRLVKKVGTVQEELLHEVFLKLNFYLGFVEYL